jgi:hypothetical protein
MSNNCAVEQADLSNYVFEKVEPKDLKIGSCYIVAKSGTPTLATLESEKYTNYGGDDFWGAYVHTYNFVPSVGEPFSLTKSSGYRDCGGSLMFNNVYRIRGSVASLESLRDDEKSLLAAFSAFQEGIIASDEPFYCV